MDRAVSLEARRVDLAIEPPFQFGRARVNPSAHEISWGSDSRRIQPQTLKVLVALHDRIGEVVSRDELVDRCWDGRFVGEDVINRSISILRRVAAECGGSEIQTIPKRGYRLIEPPPSVPETPGRRRSGWAIGASTAAAAAAIIAATLVERSRSESRQTLVAVEPLKARPDDRPAQALSEGMSSSIERDLAGSGTPIEMVDEKSGNAAFAVRGASISDRDELRASLDLVDLRSGKILWASNFERPASEFEQLRDQLSLQVARELHCVYADGRRPYVDTDAEFARLSLAHCDILGHDWDEAVRLDAQIVQRAPAFARGWAEYAIDTGFASRDLAASAHAAGDRRAIALAHHALALDPHQGLAYTAIGVATEDGAPWLDSERLARRALIADPKSPEAHNWQSSLLTAIGRIQDGLKEARLSYDLDHFLPGKIDQLIWIDLAAGNLDDAQDELALAKRYWPNNIWFDGDAVELGIAGRVPDQALTLLVSNKVKLSKPRTRALTAFLKWRIAPTPASRLAAIGDIEAAYRAGEVTAEPVELLARLGDFNAAYALATRMTPSTASEAGWYSPDLAPFRDDPRFMPLVARLGLGQIWQASGLWPDFCNAPGKLPACRRAIAAAVKRSD